MSLLAATQQQFIWKDEEMRRFAVTLVAAAVKLGPAATFTTDIVPQAKRGDGQGIAGSITSALCGASVIVAVGMHDEAGIFYHKVQKSTRPGANGRKIGVYRLGKSEIVQSFLDRNQTAEDVSTVTAPQPEPELLTV